MDLGVEYNFQGVRKLMKDLPYSLTPNEVIRGLELLGVGDLAVIQVLYNVQIYQDPVLSDMAMADAKRFRMSALERLGSLALRER